MSAVSIMRSGGHTPAEGRRGNHGHNFLRTRTHTELIATNINQDYLGKKEGRDRAKEFYLSCTGYILIKYDI